MKRMLSIILTVALMLSVMVAPVAFAADAAPASDIIIEVGSEFVTEDGGWDKGSSLMGPTGNPSWYSRRDKEMTVKFSTSHVAPGEYEVSFWKIPHTDGRNDKALDVEITSGDNTTATVVNCDEGSAGWVSLGKFTFNEGDDDGVKVIRKGKTDAICSRAAAIKLTPIKIFTEADAAATVVSGGDQYINDLLTYIGVSPIIDLSQPDAQVTRAQFLAAVMKALAAPATAEAEDFLDVPATHTYYNEIRSARANGIVAGDGNGYFKPDDAIAFEEAAKIAIHALELLSTIENIGVERANAQGGYTVGYILELNKQGLAKGLSADVSAAPLTTESVKTIILNILNAKIREIVTEDRVTVLERVHDIYEAEGKLNAVYGTSVKADAVADEGYAIVNNDRYAVGDLLVDEFLAQEIEYYYVDKDLSDLIIAMRSQPATEVTEIAAEDVLSVIYNSDTKNFEIEYYDENSKVEKTAVHSENAEIYFNNVKITDAVAADFRPLEGSLKLIGNGSKTRVDYAFITSYENFVVKRTNVLDEKVYDVDNNDLDLKASFAEKYELIRNNKVVDISKVQEWDVLSIPVKREGTAYSEVAKIQIARKKVEGLYDSKSSKEIFVDGKAYEISVGYKDAFEANTKIAIGKSITLYLDINGKVAYADEGKTVDGNFAWLTRAAKTKGLGGAMEIEAFLSTGTWENLKLAESVLYTEGDAAPARLSAQEVVDAMEVPFDMEAAIDEDIEEIKRGMNTYWYYPSRNVSTANSVINETNANSYVEYNGGWKWSNSTVLVYPGDTSSNDANSVYSQANGDSITYKLSGMEPGSYEFIYYHVKHSNGSDMINYTLEVSTAANGVSGNLNTLTGDPASTPTAVSLGVFEVTGNEADNEYVKLTIDGLGSGKRVRIGALQLVTPFDEVAKRDELRAEYEASLATRPADIKKMVEYVKNADGFVKEIKVLNADQVGVDHKPFFKSVNAFVSGNSLLFSVDTNTKVFVMPEDEDEKAEYRVGNGSMFKQGERFYYTTYNENENGYAPILSVKVGAASDDEGAAEVYVVKNTAVLYDATVEAEINALKVADGEKEAVLKEKVLEKGEVSIFAGLEFGDVIKVNSRDTKGNISEITLLHDVSEAVSYRETGSTSQGTHVAVATVDNITSTKLFLNYGGDDTRMYSVSGAKVYICDVEEQTITSATAGSIAIDDVVVYTSYKFNPTTIIAFK